MSKNTSISLGDHFDQFMQSQLKEGRYKNACEIIRAGLRLLENEESKVTALKTSIQEGIDSGIAHDFDPKKHLASLKANKELNEYNWISCSVSKQSYSHLYSYLTTKKLRHAVITLMP